MIFRRFITEEDCKPTGKTYIVIAGEKYKISFKWLKRLCRLNILKPMNFKEQIQHFNMGTRINNLLTEVEYWKERAVSLQVEKITNEDTKLR